ncbi:hypothetical protein MRX96_003427 [Rhipicephalus microplus]
MRLIYAFEGTDDELLDQVRRKCFGDFYPPASQAAYRGRVNDTLDRPITFLTCSYALATSASFTTQLVASPFRTNFVPIIRSLPSPRNIDPRLHQGRREARVEALERTYAHKNTTYYVDAANYDHANDEAVATVVDHTLTERTSASVRCHNITEAEETAIALALALGYRQRRSLTVLTDSQAACRNYLQGRISQPALNVILSATDAGEHRFVAGSLRYRNNHACSVRRHRISIPRLPSRPSLGIRGRSKIRNQTGIFDIIFRQG